MEGSADTEPDLAIGTAKEFVESICKTILDEREEPYGKNDDLLALVRKTTKVLQLTPDDIASAARAAETIKRMLMNLAQLVQGSAELRNAYGTGHGRSRAQARQRLEPRHARLAVGTATTLGVFLYETHEAREQARRAAPMQRSLKAAGRSPRGRTQAGEQQAPELVAGRLDADLLPGQLTEQGAEFPGDQVAVPGSEDAQLSDAVVVVEVQERLPDHLEQVRDAQ